MSQIYDTMEEQIEDELEEMLGYRNLRKYVKVKDIQTKTLLVVPHTSITNEYRYFLQDHIVTIDLSDEEYLRYRKNPHALSADIYGTTQYWALILELNHCKSRINFDKRQIRVYNPDTFETVIEEIMDKEGLLENV